MSKIKLDDRIERSVTAFFKAEPDHSHLALTYTGREAALAADEIAFPEKAYKWVRILRELSLFVPGTFFLFYSTLSMVYFYSDMGITPMGFFMVISSAFLTYAGLGNLRQAKNLAVPAVIAAMALGVALLSSLFHAKEQPNLYFWYSVYLFPNVLIAGKLIQGWMSDEK